jgi:hypothetical protein
VQQIDRGPVGGAGFGLTDIEQAGIDLLQRAERGGSRLNSGQLLRICLDSLYIGRTNHAELGRGKGHGRSPEKAAALMIDVFGYFDLIHGVSPCCDDCIMDKPNVNEKALQAQVEKLDFELSIGDGLRLCDQLVHPLCGNRSVALFVNVNSVSCGSPSLSMWNTTDVPSAVGSVIVAAVTSSVKP